MIGIVPVRSVFLVLIGLAAAAAAPPHLEEEVQALVARAAAHIQVVGPEKAFADFNRRDGGFVDGELYMFCNSIDGIVLAHGGNPRLVGRSLLAVRDGAGNQPIAEIDRIALTTGHGWVVYLWPNPVTGRVQHKTSYVMRIDEHILCGAGYFTADPP